MLRICTTAFFVLRRLLQRAIRTNFEDLRRAKNLYDRSEEFFKKNLLLCNSLKRIAVIKNKKRYLSKIVFYDILLSLSALPTERGWWMYAVHNHILNLCCGTSRWLLLVQVVRQGQARQLARNGNQESCSSPDFLLRECIHTITFLVLLLYHIQK